MSDESNGALPIPATRLPATVKHLKFAQFYLECGNVAEAARRAGFQAPTEQALLKIGTRLLQRDDVGLYVARHLEALISAEETGAILADIARSDISVFMRFTATGDFEWDFTSPQAQANMHLISSIKRTEKGIEVALHSKLQALALIVKYVPMDTPQAMQRRALEMFLAQLSPERRAWVREELLRERSPGVIEGKQPSYVEEDVDLSFLRAGAHVPAGSEPTPPPDAESDDE